MSGSSAAPHEPKNQRSTQMREQKNVENCCSNLLLLTIIQERFKLFAASKTGCEDCPSLNEVAIYPKKVKLLGIAIGALLFVILGCYFAQNRVALGLSLRTIIITSYVGIPFFGLCLVYAIYRLLIPKPAVVISDEGIFDNASAVGAGMLRWEEIADIFAYDFMGQRMLGIIPVNEEIVLRRQTRLKRVIAKMNKGIAPAQFNIPQSVLPISVDELLSRVEERRTYLRSP
jgi:hypothetical protein